MTRILLALHLFLLAIFTSHVNAAALPQEQFLQIYLLIQEGEKLETANQKASARSLYQVSEERLGKLNKKFPEWEPTIVKYRLRYCQDKLESLKDAVDADLDKPAPIIPPEIIEGTTAIATAAATAVTPIERPTSAAEIMEKAAPTGMAPVIEISGDTPTSDSDDPTVLKGRIRTLETQLADAQEKISQTTAEAAQLRTRVAELEKALTVAREGTSDEKLSSLMAENNSLKEKLASAEATIAKVQSGDGSGSVVALDEQLKKIQDQLNLSRQENEALRQTSEEFKAKLQEVQKQLDEANIKIAGLPKEDPIRKENEMMRNLIRREQAEFERRKIANRIALEELQALKIDSEKLKNQINLLGSPLVMLSEDEKALLRQPSSGLQVDASAGNISAPATTSPDALAAEISSRPKVPEDFKDVAREANELFAAQKFDDAAARYQTILNVYPDSLYALSNISVVRFQQQKYPLAEEYLRRAVKLAPQDAFSHSILGIVLYQQGKIDDAIQILTRAVALDPNDAKSRNYLGIAASQKGWQEAAEQECRRAIELDPQYGDAHFNLAVIYATQKPPARELASRHYKRALELGIPRDSELEKMLK
jgi:Flp pilus assembly protein TadD